MKVSDLIKKLQKVDQEAEIIYASEHHFFMLEEEEIKESFFKKHPSYSCYLVTGKEVPDSKKGIILHY